MDGPADRRGLRPPGGGDIGLYRRTPDRVSVAGAPWSRSQRRGGGRLGRRPAPAPTRLVNSTTTPSRIRWPHLPERSYSDRRSQIVFILLTVGSNRH